MGCTRRLIFLFFFATTACHGHAMGHLDEEIEYYGSIFKERSLEYAIESDVIDGDKPELEIPVGLRYYGRLFSENEPEVLLSDNAFDIDSFGHFAVEFLKALQINPVIPSKQLYEFISTFRAIVAYSSIDRRVMPLVNSLPLSQLFDVALAQLKDLSVDTHLLFKEVTAAPNEFISDDKFWRYFDEESRLALANFSLLFLFSFHDEKSQTAEGAKYEESLRDLSEKSKIRLLSMMMRQIKTIGEVLERLSLSNELDDNAFFAEGRFLGAKEVIIVSESSLKGRGRKLRAPAAQGYSNLATSKHKRSKSEPIKRKAIKRAAFPVKHRARTVLQRAHQDNLRLYNTWNIMLMAQAIPLLIACLDDGDLW